jgi:DNA-binding beta-propeller fold protein YncE
MRRVSLRTIYIILLVVPISITAVLLYLYFTYSRPVGALPYETRQMKFVNGLYGYGTLKYELLYRPTDVAFDKDGLIYVADTGHARILVFNSSGNYIRKIGSKGFDRGGLSVPVGVTVSEDGYVYVADKKLNKIVVYDPDGGFSNEFKVNVPLKPYISKDKLYVATYGHIMIYDLHGRELAKWGNKGRSRGDFDSPTGIAVGASGNVYVSDTFNLRLQAFNKKGEVMWMYGRPPIDTKAENREFGLPCGIAVDEKENLFLADAFESCVKVLDSKGHQIAVLGKSGSKEGELNQPAGIAYYKDGLVAVADKFNDRIQIFRFDLN